MFKGNVWQFKMKINNLFFNFPLNVSYIRAFLFLILTSFFSISHGMTTAECNYLSSEINKDLPSRINAYSTAITSMCIGTQPIYLVYHLRAHYPKSQFDMNSFQHLRQGQINLWCSTPSQRRLLKQVGIKYVYFDSANIYIGETSFTFKDCPR